MQQEALDSIWRKKISNSKEKVTLKYNDTLKASGVSSVAKIQVEQETLRIVS